MKQVDLRNKTVARFVNQNNRFLDEYGINFLSARCMIGLHHSKAESVSDSIFPRDKGNGAGNDEEEESMPRDQRKKRLQNSGRNIREKGWCRFADPLGCWLELGVSQREELCLLTQEVIAAPMTRAGRGARGSRNGAVPYDTRGRRERLGRFDPWLTYLHRNPMINCQKAAPARAARDKLY